MAQVEQTYRTLREREIYTEYNETLKKLQSVVNNEEYMNKCNTIHSTFMKRLYNNPFDVYMELRKNPNQSMLHFEAVVLNLLKKIFEIDIKEKIQFDKRDQDPKSDKEDLQRDYLQYSAMFDQCIIRVSHIFFKSRYYLA